MLFSINSFSRLSAPRSEVARGNERSNKVRSGLGVTWKVSGKVIEKVDKRVL